MAARKETRSIRELVGDIAYRKQRAAQARFAGTRPGLEAPRDVYLGACSSIAAELEGLGYKYAKSGPHARRRFGDLTFQIGFQSSFNNVAGEHVRLCMHGNVWSRRIKKWRQQQSLYASDYVAGGQIGSLQKDQVWFDWELARPQDRPEVIRDAVNVIEKLAFPYFAKFEDLPALFGILVNEDFPRMTIGTVVDFLMCFADHLTARAAGVGFLRRRPDLIPSYRDEYRKLGESESMVRYCSTYAHELAFASHKFEFGDLTR